MYFTVPTLTATPGKDTSVAIWAGVGGATQGSAQELVQAGVFSEIDFNGNLKTPYAWWEVISSDSSQTGKPWWQHQIGQWQCRWT